MLLASFLGLSVLVSGSGDFSGHIANMSTEGWWDTCEAYEVGDVKIVLIGPLDGMELVLSWK